MAPKKLSDADRQDILKRYRQSEENTVTIANSYGVSTSTVSRILKQNLSETEYESLIQQKRSGTHKSVTEQVAEQVDLPGFATQAEPPGLVPEVLGAEVLGAEIAEPRRGESKPVIPPPRRRQRQRSDDLASLEEFSQPSQLELTSVIPVREDDEEEEPDNESLSESFVSGSSLREKPVVEKPIREKPVIAKRELEEIEAELGKKSLNADAPLAEDLDDEDLDDDELEDDLDDDEDLDDEDDLDDGELPTNRGFSTVQIQKNGFLQVLPLSDAAIPKTCYIVVDRSSELITRPLKDFADLGQIPEEEIQAKTLPVFDNHRIAKRFTRRMQRVVKVPDGKMFHKVRPYLQAKGITRLLIDGQVYSL